MSEAEPGEARANSEPKVTMSAVKLDRDGNVVEEISFENVKADISPGFLAQMHKAVREGWEAKPDKRKDENG